MKKMPTLLIFALALSTILLAACTKTGPNQYTIDPFKAVQDVWAKRSSQAAREAAQKAQKDAQKEIRILSISMAEKIANSGERTIAVVDFVDVQGNITELGRYLAEEFSVGLAGANKGFEVIDRTYLKSILKEHKLSLTGLIDSATVKKLGKITGADAIVTGTTIPLGNIVRVTVKVLDTETARVISASAANIGNTQAIKNLLASKIMTPVVRAGRPSSAPGEMVATIQKVESHNFTFELKECRLSGNSITCKLLITNNAEDRYFKLYYREPDYFDWWYPKSRMFDDLGNGYWADWIQIANKMSSSSYSELSVLLVSSVPTRAVLGFENVSPRARRISLLELGCAIKGGRFTVQFRNISVPRR